MASYVILGTLPTPILVVPHLNMAESYFMKFDKTMGYSLLIIPIVVPFFLLIMPQGTGQHNPYQEMRMTCRPFLQWTMLNLIKVTYSTLVISILKPTAWVDQSTAHFRYTP